MSLLALILLALLRALLLGIIYAAKLALDVLRLALLKLYIVDLGAYIPAARVTEIELWCLGNLRANLADMGLLARRGRRVIGMEPLEVLDGIREEREEEWMGWNEEQWEAWGEEMV